MASTFQSFDRSPLGAFIRSPLGARGAGMQALGPDALFWGTAAQGTPIDFANAVAPYVVNVEEDGIVPEFSRYSMIFIAGTSTGPHWWAAFLSAVSAGWRGTVVFEVVSLLGAFFDERRAWLASQSGFTGMGLGGHITDFFPFVGLTANKVDHPLTTSFGGVVGDWPEHNANQWEITGGEPVYVASSVTTIPGAKVVASTTNGNVRKVFMCDPFSGGRNPPSLSNEMRFWSNLKSVGP